MPKTKRQLPKAAKLKKPPRRKPNRKLRTREYLTTQEITTLRKSARGLGRYGHRDDTWRCVLTL